MDWVQDLKIKPGGISSNCHHKTVFLYRKFGSTVFEETEAVHFCGLLYFFFKGPLKNYCCKSQKCNNNGVFLFVWGMFNVLNESLNLVLDVLTLVQNFSDLLNLYHYTMHNFYKELIS